MLYLGTSGYSYDDWKARWYPPALSRSKMLEYYAERFNAVEINSTFYRIPPARMMDGLVRRAGDRLIFTVKVSQQISHNGDLSDATTTLFLKSIEPMAKADRLGALLVQFPFRFHWNRENQEYVERTARMLRGFPLAIEMRHASWDAPDALRFFRDTGLSRCLTDMPRLHNLPAASSDLTGPVGYLRFHGRNGDRWFESDNAADPYDYLYSREELAAWVEPVKAMERKAETAFVFFNNHLHGQAPVNAGMFLEMLGLEAPREGYRDLFGPGGAQA